MTYTRRSALTVLIGAPFLAGCGTPPIEDKGGAPELTRALIDLGPEVDPSEAARAADIAYAYTDVLAEEYEITTSPLVHNGLVNAGLKPRGLCWHWAEDMERRLNAEDFETLTLHRAIAEHEWRIDHSTAIISARGDDFDQGLVIDPWRYGGVLYWGSVAQDDRYAWQRRTDVLERKMREDQLR
ncbi:MAG: hypothetical protein HRU32_10180, partial [Rhodobacteraceae bacterium]|nr:hypothetical protein [Paracoccaceae bacterium]